MKNLLKTLLNLLKVSKVADLDNDGKIETLQEEVQGLFSQFKTMSETLEKTNSQLKEVAEDERVKREEEIARMQALIDAHNKKLDESNSREERVWATIEKNNKLKDKVDEFTV